MSAALGFFIAVVIFGVIGLVLLSTVEGNTGLIIGWVFIGLCILSVLGWLYSVLSSVDE